jgi:hypothetical protein
LLHRLPLVIDCDRLYSDLFGRGRIFLKPPSECDIPMINASSRVDDWAIFESDI